MSNSDPPSTTELADAEAHRFMMEARCRQIGSQIGEGLHHEDGALGTHTGFALFLFDFRENGTMAYVSSAQRSDMVMAVRSMLVKIESGEA